MSRNELGSFMAQVSPWLEVDGEIILCCMNRITWRRFLAEIYKKCTGYYRRVHHVFWGYWRSLGEFFHVARVANLRVSQVYRFGGPTGLISQSALQRALFPRNDPNVLIVFTKI